MEAIPPLLIAEECHQNPATECGGVNNWHTPTNTSGYAEPSGSGLPNSTQAVICPLSSPAWDAPQSNSYVPACPQGYLADASTATSTFWLPRNTVRLDCFLDGSGCCNQMYPTPTRVAYDYANVVDMYAPTSSYASPPAYRDASSLGLGSSTCSDLLALEVYALPPTLAERQIQEVTFPNGQKAIVSTERKIWY